MKTNHNQRLIKSTVVLGIFILVLTSKASFVSGKEKVPLTTYNNTIQPMSLNYDEYADRFEYHGRTYLYSEIRFKESQEYTYFLLDEEKKEIAITKILNAKGDITVPDELDGYKVVCLGVPLHNFAAYEEGLYQPKSQYSLFQQEDMNKVTSLTIPEGITHIGIAAFMNMANLKQVILPDSLVSIGIEAFANSGIEKLVLPKNLELIDLCAFYSCESLTNVIVNCGNVRGGGEYPSFKACDNLELVTWGNVGYADVDLFSLSTIKRVVIPASVNKVDMTCCSIETLIIKGKNTAFVTVKDLGKSYWNDKFAIIVPEASKAISTIKELDVDYEEVVLPKAFTVKTTRNTIHNTQVTKLIWNKQSNTTKYQIYYSKTKNGKYQLLKETEKLSYSTTKVTGYIKIRGYRTYQGVNWYGAYTTVKL